MIVATIAARCAHALTNTAGDGRIILVNLTITVVVFSVAGGVGWSRGHLVLTGGPVSTGAAARTSMTDTHAIRARRTGVAALNEALIGLPITVIVFTIAIFV